MSSATVRNDMAALEQEGYLRQPHTSAGRIPTEKGYRFFVDHLGQPASLRRQDAVQVRSFFEQAHGELEQMLHDTSRLLGDLTTYAGVVVGPASGDTAHPLDPARGDLAHGRARSWWCCPPGRWRSTRSSSPTPSARSASARPPPTWAPTSPAWAGTRSRDAPAHAATTPPTRSAARPSPPSPASTGEVPDQVFVGGTSQVARAFDAIETVREVLGVLEQQYVVVTLLRDVLDRGLQVAIGTETGMAPLAECALIVAPYQAEGEPAGTIGVLGPSRMDYQQAMATVAVVSHRLSQRLSDG